ncbi:MAG: LLM class flavin-dependent oxidoreductase [Pseudomonadota bacterium]|nr:LLM class flavin-dependent oxidoreductase [Pseudomonadota bacterium]
MTRLSVLDLAPITEGSDAGAALRNARALAIAAEHLGYHRFWMAEHHSMPGIASAATAVALGFVAEGTNTIRIGSGGIMLPNHSPLQVAEQFGTLASLYPGRIDLGLGRAPGTDQAAAYAMRRSQSGDANQFPRDVVELIRYLEAPSDPPAKVRAIPGEGTNIPVWILGSSLYGAQLAAHLGLPYAFASHFAPEMLDEALHLYRRDFQPSQWLAEPYVMLGFNVFAADSDDEGQLLATSLAQAFVALRTGTAGQLKPPQAGYLDSLPASWRASLDERLSCAAIGAPATVRAATNAFIDRTGADELMITGQIFDSGARLRSYEILADLFFPSSKSQSTATSLVATAD